MHETFGPLPAKLSQVLQDFQASPEWSTPAPDITWGTPAPTTYKPPALPPAPEPAKFITPAHKKSLPLLHVFVDEYGDRNFKENRESEWFTMTALLVEQEHLDHLRAAISGMRQIYRIPDGNKLHWVEHFRKKQPARRLTALHLLTSIPHIRVVNVLLHKPTISGNAKMRDDSSRSYHMMTLYLLERVAKAAAGWPGGERLAKVSLGVVGGVDHRDTQAHLHAQAILQGHTSRSPFGNLLWPFKWFDSAELDGLQAADIFSGFLTAALVNDDAIYYQKVLKLVTHDSWGNHLGEGMKIFPNEAVPLITASSWWRSCPGARYWVSGELTHRVVPEHG